MAVDRNKRKISIFFLELFSYSNKINILPENQKYAL